jgi:hypothetical protein
MGSSRGLLTALLPIGLVIVSCAPAPSPSGLSSESTTSTFQGSAVVEPPCPVTAPNQSEPPNGQVESVHLGNGKLGTDLWPDGTVIARSEWIHPDGSIALKWGWWRGPGVVGLVNIEGRRLDAPGPDFSAQSPKEGYGDSGFTPSDVTFPGPGCWEVTARVGDARLSFVTRVVLP